MKKLAAFLPLLAALYFIGVPPVSSQVRPDFSKTGEVHSQVIHLWDTHYRDYFAGEIKRRLLQDGDVYVLYDVQISGLQSFVEMTRRCKDIRQIAELTDLLNPVFSVLKPISDTDGSTGWICTGGNICTAYKLIGKEVPLCSSQFLGLIGALATSISENIPPRQRTATQKAFLSEAFNTMAIHLSRWFTTGYLASIDRRIQATSADIKDGSSRDFFTDRDLWYLTALSDLSELYKSGIHPATEDGKRAFEVLLLKKEGIQKAFDLFVARTVLTALSNGARADLDKGFWRLYSDNRYAGYTGGLSPVGWEEAGEGKWEMKTLVKWDSTHIAPDAGWDISHSRRLVPALETFARNRENIKALWGYDNPAFDPVALRQAFANQVVEKIWNGDTKYPLFTNFWSGDNGWYRVAYAANETGRRFAGYPPYGLSISIADGGYPVWGAFHPTLKAIFRNIFELSRTEDPIAESFASKHYQGLFGGGSDKKSIRNLAFLSDLVELPSGDPGK